MVARPPGSRGGPAVATGSHLDSVPDGGPFDGPLGVISALLAIDLLRQQGHEPRCPVGLAVFADEEGARFGVACVGSRLMTGVLDPARARALSDSEGVALEDALTAAGLDPALLGEDRARIEALGCFVELHVEQGRALADLGSPVAVATSIWPHGRWRLDLEGEANHAGTTRVEDRRDPMLPLADAVIAARQVTSGRNALATIGRVTVVPNATNGVASRVQAWLDARAADEATLDLVVRLVRSTVEASAAAHGVSVRLSEESRTPAVLFDTALSDRVAAELADGRGDALGDALGGGDVPRLATGAGHDAGILAGRLPTAMLFVRNPTGVSHSPAEAASLEDCAAGVRALAAVLADLSS